MRHHTARPRRVTFLRRPSPTGLLTIGFLLTHVWLLFASSLTSHPSVQGDVVLYGQWMHAGFTQGNWPVLDHGWVYPVGALIPMAAAYLLSGADADSYRLGWAAVAVTANAATTYLLVHAGHRAGTGTRAGWWWLGFLAALGPVAVFRLEPVTVLLTVFALTVLANRPGWQAAALTSAAWVKVWPAAVLLCVWVLPATRKTRARLVGAATAVTLTVALAAAAGGATLSRVFGFTSEQSGRGLQVESVAATPFMWSAATGGPHRVGYSASLDTYEISGPYAGWIATALPGVTLALTIATLMLTRAAYARARDDAARRDVFCHGLLAVLTGLVATDPVGSPQYLLWLTTVVVVALIAPTPGASGRWRPIAAAAIGTCLLTQAIFPFTYAHLVAASLPTTAVLTARNALLVGLLVWSWARLTHASRAAVDEVATATPRPGLDDAAAEGPATN